MLIQIEHSTEPLILFIELGATEEQADFPIIYANAITAQAGMTPDSWSLICSRFFSHS